MLGDIQDVYLGDVRGVHRRGESGPIRRALGGAGMDAVSVWRSVCRDLAVSSAMAVRAACSSARALFSVLAASSAVTESRLMGAASAAVDDVDGVVGEQGVGSADVGQVRCGRRVTDLLKSGRSAVRPCP